MQTLRYRPEIDGLRALAIIPIVLFHVGVPFLTGGYVGVDVFFVISGYLISGVILTRLEAGTFAYRDFWARRVRRILPAATLVILVVLVAAFALMPPWQFREVGASAAYQSVFLESIHLALEKHDYYGVESHQKPLLHTWSLSIEELFYLVFPLLLVTLWRRGRRWAIYGCLGVALASLAHSVLGGIAYPYETYYLLTARAWELLIGVLARLLQLRVTGRRAELLSWGGLGLVAWACVGFDDQTVFPGVAALVPTLGTAAIIVGSEAGLTRVGRLLAWSPLVYVGKISYSLYLWHWPVIVFATLCAVEPLGAAARALLVAVSVALSVLSYRLVEEPCRRGGPELAVSRVYGAGLAGVAIVAILGGLVAVNAGWPERFPDWVHRDRVYPDTSDDLATVPTAALATVLADDGLTPIGRPGPPNLLIWSDSHGFAQRDAWDAAARSWGLSGRCAMRSAALPVPQVWAQRGSVRDEVLAGNAAVEQWVYDSGVRHVILIGRWSAAVHALERQALSAADDQAATGRSSADRLEAHLAGLVGRLQARGVSVWIMQQPPEHPFDPIAKRIATRGRIQGITRAAHDAYQAQTHAILAATGARLMDPAPHLFGADGRSLLQAADGRSLWYDGDHLSTVGAERLAPLMEQVMAEIAADIAAASP